VALAAVQLFRHRLGRSGLGALLFGAGLLTFNPFGLPLASRIPAEGYLFAEALFGSSILLLVLDESRSARDDWQS